MRSAVRVLTLCNGLMSTALQQHDFSKAAPQCMLTGQDLHRKITAEARIRCVGLGTARSARHQDPDSKVSSDAFA